MRSITYDGIDSRHLLANHQKNSDDGAFAIARDTEHLLEQGLGRSLANKSPFGVELLGHLLYFVANVVGIGRQSTLVSPPFLVVTKRWKTLRTHAA